MIRWGDKGGFREEKRSQLFMRFHQFCPHHARYLPPHLRRRHHLRCGVLAPQIELLSGTILFESSSLSSFLEAASNSGEYGRLAVANMFFATPAQQIPHSCQLLHGRI